MGQTVRQKPPDAVRGHRPLVLGSAWMDTTGTIVEPSVVVVGARRSRAALGALFDSWGWPVVSLEADDLAGVAAVRCTDADLLVIDGSGHGCFGDLDLARSWLAPKAVVRLVDRPEDLTTDPSALLLGVPADQLRRGLLAALGQAGVARVAP